MTTINKGYATPTTGSLTGQWGTTLNEDVFEIVDRNLGGIVSKSLSSSNVTLTTEESQNAIVRLTGTLTANVVIQTECIGFFFVENLTAGAFTVTIRNDQVATAATIAQGSRQTVLSDATNGCRILSSGFETGVKTVFYMSTAPVGWTRDATAALNNAAIRLVTTGGAATAGSVDFTTAFSSTRITLAQENLPNVSLTAEANGAHTHFVAADASDGGSTVVTAGEQVAATRANGQNSGYILGGTATAATLGLTSSNGTHTHNVPLGGSATPISLAVKYADCMIATKD